MRETNKQFSLTKILRAWGLCLIISSLIISPAFAQVDMEAVLDSNDGSSALSVQDSTTAEVMRIDSDGNVQLDGDLTVSGNDIIMGINTSGYILIGDGTNFSPAALTGDGTLTATGSFTITANAVGLGTDTTGDFVERIAAGDGISSTGASTGEGIEHTLAVELKTVGEDAVGTTSSVSGLEFESGELTLLQGCGDGQILKWEEDDDSWHCVADVGGAGFNTLDESYDEGGAGAGRTINVDSGAVQLLGTGGDEALEVTSSGTGGAVLIENTSTGLSLRVNDGAADVTPVVIDADGQVGIGVLTPTAALDVRGTLFIENTSADVTFQINDQAADPTPFTITATGLLTTGADAIIGGDLSVTGDDITMATNNAGYILVADGTSFSPVPVSGDGTLSATGVLTISSGSIDLGTDTSGDYVARIVGGDGIASTASTTGETTEHTLSVDLITTASGSATTGSFSGLEFVSGELAMLQGCADAEHLTWDATVDRWQCTTDAGAAATLQSVYGTDADGSDARITLTSADDSIVFINPAAAGTDSGTLFFVDQNDTTGVAALGVDSEGTDDYAVEIRHQGDDATTTEAAVFVEAEAGSGALYLHRNVGATTTGSLIFIHEENAAADVDVLHLLNQGTGLSLRVSDQAADATPVVITAAGQVGIGTAAPGQALDVVGSVAVSADALITGDATISGNDITMGTNTAGYVLLSDGTNFSPDGLTGDGTISATGTFTITANAVGLGTDTTGDFVGRIVGGDGIDSTAASSGESTQHTLSVDLITAASGSATTGSFSGLEFVSGELAVLQGCSDNEILKWDETVDRWQCATDQDAGATATLQSTYNTDPDGGDVTIQLTAADDSIVFINPLAAGTDSGTLFFLDQNDTTGVIGLQVDSEATDTFALSVLAQGDTTTSTAAGIGITAESGAGALYVTRNQGAGVTDDALMVVSEQGAADTTVVQITNQGTGDSLLVEDVATDTTPFRIDGLGVVTTGANAIIGGDLSVTGNDITMAVNNAGYILVADGTNFSPVPVSGDGTLSATGVLTISTGSIDLGTDTSGDYVERIIGGDGIDSTAATTGEGTEHTLSVDLLTAASGSATTGSFAGLEFVSGELGLLQGCADNEILKWDETVDRWQCSPDGGAGSTLQDTYNSDPDGTDVTIALTAADGSLLFRNPAAGGTASGTMVFISQDDTTGVIGLQVDSEVTDTFAAQIFSQGDGATTSAAGLAVTAESGAGGLFVYRNQTGATTDGTLTFIHEDEATADTDVLMIQNDGTGLSLRIADSTGDATPVVVTAAGAVGIGTASPSATLEVVGDVVIGGDLSVTGDDITMGTNNAGYILVADGTSFSPVPVSGDGTLSATGVLTISTGSIDLGTDTSGDYVQRIIGGDGIDSTAATTGESTEHTLSVDLVTAASGSATTGSFSGLEFVSGELSILQGCDDNEILKWDETVDRWQCETDQDAGATATLQSVYNTDADGSDARITLTGADDSIVFINPAAAGTDSGTMLFLDQNDTTGVIGLEVDSEVTDTFAARILSQGDGATTGAAGLAVTAESGAGGLYVYRNQGAATTDGTLTFIHEDEATADTDVVMIQNDGTGLSLRIADSTGDATPVVIDAAGQVGIGTATPSEALEVIGTLEVSADAVVGANALITGDATIGGNDITMATNTAGYLLLSDGTNFSPDGLTGDGTISATGTFTISADAVGLGTDTTGDYVARIVGGDGVSSTAASSGESTQHTLAVDLLSAGVDGGTSTGSVSGMEFINGELTLVTGCDNGEILKWNEAEDRWFCDADAGAGGGNTLNQAYDSGGPGLGRTITADAGAVVINGSVTGDDALELTATGTNSGLFIESTATNYLIRANDSAGDVTPFLIDADGQVGIGTATPTAMVDVRGTLFIENTSADVTFQINDTAADATPFTIDANGVVTTGANAIIGGDLSVTGNDITMATNTAGYILLSDGTNFSPDGLTGDGTISATGTFTISANAVGMGTDTFGDYVARIVGGDGIDSTAASSGESTQHTLSVDLVTAASGSATTGSFSGLEFVSGELGMLQGCADNEILKWDETVDRWQCSADGGAGSTLQDTYNADADGSDVRISLTTADDSIVFINPAAAGTDSGTLFFVDQNDATGVIGLEVDSEVTDTFAARILSQGDGATTSAAGLAVTAESGAGGLYVYRNQAGATTDGTLAFIHEDDATADTDVVMIQNDGAGNALRVNTNGTNFVIDRVGRVGIGVASPGAALHVRQNANAPSGIHMQNETNGTAAGATVQVSSADSAGTFSALPSGYTGALNLADRVALVAVSSATGLDLISQAATGDVRIYAGGITTADEVMRITSAGNVGIGTLTPTGSLHVSGGDAIFGADITVSGNDITMGVNNAGYILVADGTNFSPVPVSGDGTLSATGVLTLSAGATDLGTDTSGDYVARIIGGDGIESTAATTGESTQHTLSVDLLTAASGSATTGSFSGLEFVSGELALLQGCGDGEHLTWDETVDRWQCTPDAGAATTLQTAYGNDADGSDARITLTSADDSIVYINPAAAGTDSGTLFFLDQNDTTGVSALHVDSEGTDDFGVIVQHAGDGDVTAEAGLYVEDEGGGGSVYVHRNLAAAATTGTLVFIHEDDATADTDVVMIQNDGNGNSLRVNTEGTAFVIDEIGRVGIGTNSPASELHISGNENDVVEARIENAGVGASALTKLLLASDTDYAQLTLGGSAAGNYLSLLNNGAGSLYISQGGATGDIVFEAGSSLSQRMIITNSGNVGIGTLTPTGSLHVFGGDAIFGADITVSGNDITMGANTAGYILLSDGTNFSPDGLTGDGTISATGTFTISANAVGMGTDTFGDYVARIVGGDGVSSTAASTGESTEHTLAVDLLNVAVNGGTSTGSVSGLEFINGELTLVTGCDNGELLKWNEAEDRWFCDADAGAGGGNTLDQAYDSGGAGAGRTITADTGAVVINSTTTGDDALELNVTGTNSGLFIESTATNYLIRANDSAGDVTPFLIDADGQVGIGTATPTAMVDVRGTLFIENTSADVTFQVNDTAADATPFTIDANGVVTTGANAIIGGDLSVTGNDITMATNTAGYILLSDGTNFSPDGLTGDGTISATGTFTISADAVGLGTDTTGDFVGRIVAGDGIDSTGASTGEATTHTLSVDLITAASGSATTGSFSGMEFVSGELALLQGCDDNEILKWDETVDRWQCETDGGAGSTLQDTYNADADGSDARITLTTADDSIVFINPAAAGTDSGTLFFVDQNDTTGVIGLEVDSEVTDTFAARILSQGDGATTSAAGLAITSENGAGGLYVYRNQGAATTDGTLTFIHEDEATADTDVVMIQNDGTGLSLRIADSTADSTPVVVTGTGAVGIGTATPAMALHVDGGVLVDTNDTTTPFYITRIGQLNESLSIYVDDNDVRFQSEQDELNNGNMRFVIDDDGGTGAQHFHFETKTGTDLVRIYANGNVGIGTVSPEGTLHVSGGDAIFDADITVSGDDITMGTNTAGYLLIADGTSFSPMGLTGDGTISATGTFTLTPGAIDLGTDTSGDYVERIVGGDGIESTAASTGEGTDHTLSIDLITAASGSATTGSFSGLEFVGGELAMLQGCGDGEHLTWDETVDRWQCTPDAGAATTLQTAYGNDADGSDARITLTSADDSIVFINPAAAGTDSGTLFFLDQNDTTGVSAVMIDSEVTDTYAAHIYSQGDGATTAAAALAIAAESGAGGLYVYRNQGAATTDGTLIFIHEDEATADTDVMMIQNDGAGNTLRLNANGTQVVFTDAGNLGIGTATPISQVHVRSNFAAGTAVTVESTNASTSAILSTVNDTGDLTDFGTGGSGMAGDFANRGFIYSQSAGFSIMSPESPSDIRFLVGNGFPGEVIITHEGNVGIGTLTPTGSLHVSGGDAIFGADITVSGNDITMGTNTAGYILISDGTNFSPDGLTGDGTISATGTFTISANAVGMGTDTTGDYVARIVGGDGIESTAASSGENTQHTLSVDLVTAASGSATTGSFSGLEFVSGELAMLQGCQDGEHLTWDETVDRWQCTTDAGASTTLQTAYGNDADGSDARITLTSADDSIVFINPAAAGTDSGTLFFLDQNDTTGVTALGIDSEGTDDYAVEIRHQGNDATTTEAALAIEAEAGSGGLYVHRNVGATTTGTLVVIHEDDGAADTDVMMIQNDGTGNSLRVNTNGTAFIISDAGYVGIGTAAPTVPLHVASNKNAATILAVQNLDSGALAGSTLRASSVEGNLDLAATNANYVLPYLADAGVISSSAGLSNGIQILTAATNAPIVFYTSGILPTDEAMRITGSGNVGIGTVTPTGSLHVSGGDAIFGADITVSGDDITMGTNTAGYILISDGTNFSPDGLTGDGTISATGTFTISANAVGMGTDTTGDYVARIVAGDGLDSTAASTGESTQHTLSVDLITAASGSATTGSFSGLEFVSGELAMLQGCQDGEHLTWDETVDRWQCTTDAGASTTLQTAYNNDADGSDATITITGTDGSIIFDNPASGGTASGTAFFIDQNDTTGVSALGIDSEGTDDFALEIRHMGDGATTGSAGIFVEAENGAGGLYVHRNQAAATTDGTLVFIHEDEATADTDVMMIQNDGDGNALRINTNGTQMVVTSTGSMGIGTASPLTMLDVRGPEGGNWASFSSATGALRPGIRIGADSGVGQGSRMEFYRANGALTMFISSSSGASGSNIIATNNLPLNFEAGTNRVGISEASAEAELEISGDGGTDDLFMVSSDDGNDGDQFIIKNSGKVGINDTTPEADLDVEGTVIIHSTVSGTALIVQGTLAGSDAISIEGSMILTDGAIDFGSATTLEIPNAVSGTVNETGELFMETDQDGIVLQAGSGVAGQIPANTDVQVPLVFQKSITMVEPDQIYTVNGTVAFFTVDSFNYPSGIVVTAARVLTSSATTDTIVLQSWDDPRSGSAVKTTIETLDIATCDGTANDVDCRDTAIGGTAAVPADRHIMIDLDDAPTDLEWMQVTVWYYVPD